jgi:L-seryl-tRNA(Ser) seleniumtransferase
MKRSAAFGVRPIINTNATLTRLGGSVMPREVAASMADEARRFVDMPAPDLVGGPS